MGVVMKTILLSIGLVFCVSGTVYANAHTQGLEAQTHPGHIGYIEGNGDRAGGVPAEHFHEVDGAPTYSPGAGGWGAAVSETAKNNRGLPNAHAAD